MIGDPSGRSSERNLLDRDDARAQRRRAARPARSGSSTSRPAPAGAILVNNLDWLGELSLIDFLRDTGKHFTVPYMLAKDSVQTRLERGLSFTEFSYMLLQAYDFWHLHRTMGVELQMGGADQWGNITAGLELIRRTAGVGRGRRRSSPPTASPTSCCSRRRARSSASREAGDSVWLDPARTTPFAFYQYWLNTDDRDVGTYLRWFTELPRERDRGARRRGRGTARGPRGAAGAGARHHGPDARRRGRGGGAIRDAGALFSRDAGRPIRRSWRRSMPRPAGSRSTAGRGWPAARPSLLADAGVTRRRAARRAG